MEELRDLKQIYDLAVEKFSTYSGRDLVLPQPFKDAVSEINNNTISYNRYSAIIETRGVQNGVLSIYLPNQWFYIASYFTDFYNELQNYKRVALTIFSKERLKELNGKNLTNEEVVLVGKLPFSEVSKAYLVKFVTDYLWWGGAKTIDRGDFYVSPILSAAKLVNASQSFVADLCALLSNKPDLVSLLTAEDKRFVQDAATYQQIYYGCPGSGKSHKVNEILDGVDVSFKFRVTFHPDTDYASFVGCYKPTTGYYAVSRDVISKDKLQSILAKMRSDKISYPIHKLATKYSESFRCLTKFEKENLLSEAGFPLSMITEMDKAIAAGEFMASENQETRIIYRFIPQAFTNAYVQAWKNPNQKVYLVIEEINRGNCAQIFGDLFQLLDRKESGESEYPVKADKDLADYLQNALGVDHDGIRGGELRLPSNLIIYATMNTSDQSLFPMDSAFKRRWEWEYVPIEYGASKESYNYIITIGEKKYRWVDFLKKVNDHIYETTRSEDKQMGNFFIKKSIDTKEFINKVMFYLWNEVCKEEYGTSRNFFREVVDGVQDANEFKFVDLFEADKANNLLIGFMKHLKVGEL